MIETDTRLRVARGIAKTETQASKQVFEALKRRGHPEAPPPTISDGLGGIDDAMVEVYGQVPPYKGIGRPPTKKRPSDGSTCRWSRGATGVAASSARSCAWSSAIRTRSWPSSAAYIERTHLTMRHMNGR